MSNDPEGRTRLQDRRKKIPFGGGPEKIEPEEGRGSIHWRKQGDQGLLSLDQAISLVLNAASILFLLGSSAAECGEAVRSNRFRLLELKPRRRPSTADITGQTLIAAHA